MAVTAITYVICDRVKTVAPTIEAFDFITEKASETETTAQSITEYDYVALSELLTIAQKTEITEDMLKAADLTKENLDSLNTEAQAGEISSERFHELTGYSLKAFVDKFGTAKSKDMGNNGKDKFVLCFSGDIGFTESDNSWYVMYHANTKPNGVLDCIDKQFQDEFKNADITLINNEFPYSDRGTALANKKYTFRAKPENVKYLNDMGVDIVSLANNHTYDYGYDAFVDTLDTLKKADIKYVGAGMNADEANAPVTFIVNGYKVGYIACSGVEWPIYTPVATSEKEGIMGSYDNGVQVVADAIRKAKTQCDYVIVYPHWGMENTTELTSAQTSNARLWIDAGADAIIGNHSHCLQGMDFYKGKFIAYSLGNFWFNARNVYTGLMKLEISKDKITPVFVPGKQFYSEATYISDPEEQKKLYREIEKYPTVNGVTIDDNGVISEKKQSL